jgi:hypothetical protein
MVNDLILAALYDAFHNSRISPKAIAEKMGVSYNYLARAVMAGDSGCNFPLHWMITFVKATGRYQALKILVNACGYLMVRNPRVSKDVKELQHGLHHFQQRFCAVIELLVRFIHEPTVTNRDLVTEKLIEHQEEAEFWKRMIKSGNVGQLEFGF